MVACIRKEYLQIYTGKAIIFNILILSAASSKIYKTRVTIRQHSASFNTNTIRMADNTNTPATKSSRDERPRKRARPNPRGTQALKNMQSVFEDQERELLRRRSQNSSRTMRRRLPSFSKERRNTRAKFTD